MRKIAHNQSQGKILKLFCPDCKKDTRHSVIQSVEENGQEEYDSGFWIAWDSKYQIVECQGCLYISFRMESANSEDLDSETGKSDITERLYPLRSKHFLTTKDYWNVPYSLRRIYREVIECFNNELYTLCAGGLRTIIEGICTDHKVKDGPVEIRLNDGTTKSERRKTIEGKIAGLFEKGILTKQNADILHEHRFMGNEALHELTQPSKDELTLAIQIIEHILDNLYELPNKGDELRTRIAKRNQQHNMKPKRAAAKVRRAP